MRPRSRTPKRVTSDGSWLAPKAKGNNFKEEGVIWFFHNSQETQRIHPTQVPENVMEEEYGCYSVYHDHGTFYTVDFDATAANVGDGRDTSAGCTYERDDSSEDEQDSEDHNDWSTLTFGLADQQRYISYAGQLQQSRRLPLRRMDQIWADQLFPDRYRAQQERYTRDRRYGGLVGDLPLLIGLVAFAMPASHVPSCLASSLGSTFSAPHNYPRGEGCKLTFFTDNFLSFLNVNPGQDRRGMVVAVYYDPRTTKREELEQYERGKLGPIFP